MPALSTLALLTIRLLMEEREDELMGEPVIALNDLNVLKVEGKLQIPEELLVVYFSHRRHLLAASQVEHR